MVVMPRGAKRNCTATSEDMLLPKKRNVAHSVNLNWPLAATNISSKASQRQEDKAWLLSVLSANDGDRDAISGKCVKKKSSSNKKVQVESKPVCSVAKDVKSKTNRHAAKGNKDFKAVSTDQESVKKKKKHVKGRPVGLVAEDVKPKTNRHAAKENEDYKAVSTDQENVKKRNKHVASRPVGLVAEDVKPKANRFVMDGKESKKNDCSAAQLLAQAPPRGAEARRSFFCARRRALRLEKEQSGKSSKPSGAVTKEIWFDGVDSVLVRAVAASRLDGAVSERNAPNCLVQKGTQERGVTRAVAIDCEFVGAGWQGRENQLARVSLVNQFGHVLLDEWVKPREKVTDYRTAVSGVRPQNLQNAVDFMAVHQRVADIIKGRILVGHALHNDLQVLLLSHPRSMIRDTQKYKPFRDAIGSGGRPGLRKLTERLLGVKIQEGEHNSVTDARATMRLYTLVKRRWEMELKMRKAQRNLKPSKLIHSTDSDDEDFKEHDSEDDS